MENSLCPSNTSKPVLVNGFIPLAPTDTDGIPSIAYSIPDFEGQAVLRIFDNATESEIACYSAMITNGNTMSWPGTVGGILGFIIFCALLASFLAATYGTDIQTTRTHYAHSLSIFVVFATFQHVYFTGALSMNWASVLPAFWSNFAWSAGMIYSPSMQRSINNFNGDNFGNTSFVGAAGVDHADSTGGGYVLAQIYKRGLGGLESLLEKVAGKWTSDDLQKRDLLNKTDGFYWYGDPVSRGLPIPGNFTGFPGTLSFERIPASNAFLTGFLWLLIIVVFLVLGMVLSKGALELLVRFKWIKEKRLQLFRSNWIGLTAMVVARTFFVAFFTIMFLSFFQFAYGGSIGVKAITSMVFMIFLTFTTGIVFFSIYYRLRGCKRVPDKLHLEIRIAWKVLPYIGFKTRSSRESEQKAAASIFSIPWTRFERPESEELDEVHQDEPYIKRYGWLVSRYRKSKWWFPSVWLIYEFIRALFFGVAAGHPSIQVFGLLIVEFIGLVTMIKMKPFESKRLNVLMIYLLGLSKVATVALSSAFHPDFGLPRIIAAGIAFVIIVIQGLLLLVMMILVFIGFFSTFFSLSRNRESLPNENWMEMRIKFFKHIDTAAEDNSKKLVPSEPIESPPPTTTQGFNVSSIRRMTKIIDEDDIGMVDGDFSASRVSIVGDDARLATRALSIHSDLSNSNLPYGARTSRQNWSADVSPIGSRRVSVGSQIGLKTAGSDPNLRHSYAVVPSNRSSTHGSALPTNRRSRSNTYRSVPVLKEEPPSPGTITVPSTNQVLDSVKGKEQAVQKDDGVVAMPVNFSRKT